MSQISRALGANRFPAMGGDTAAYPNGDHSQNARLVEADTGKGRVANQRLIGEACDDTLIGAAGNDNLTGGAGDDVLIGGPGNDNLSGGDGDDLLQGGGDNDVLRGGSDADRIDLQIPDDGAVGNVTVFGGSGGADADTLDLSALLADGWEVTKRVLREDTDGYGLSGQLTLTKDGARAQVNFHDIERIICFTPGSRIATPAGERAVETLKAGDKVFTRDNGVQPVRWVGRRDLGRAELAIQPKWAPILIRKGALGDDLPERDMYVSANHRMLLARRMATHLFSEPEVLVAAKHLTQLPGIDQVRVPEVSYIHLLFDAHEVVLADGHWTESFQPGDYSLRGLGDAQRGEILALFPELASADGLRAYKAARRSLKKREALDLLT